MGVQHSDVSQRGDVGLDVGEEGRYSKETRNVEASVWMGNTCTKAYGSM